MCEPLKTATTFLNCCAPWLGNQHSKIPRTHPHHQPEARVSAVLVSCHVEYLKQGMIVYLSSQIFFLTIVMVHKVGSPR